MTNKLFDGPSPDQINSEIWAIKNIPRGHYCPDYSGDISDAWELVDEVSRSKYFLKLSTPQNESGLWSVKIDLKGYGDSNPPSPGGFWLGTTAPLVISRAYLEWIKNRKSENERSIR